MMTKYAEQSEDFPARAKLYKPQVFLISTQSSYDLY